MKKLKEGEILRLWFKDLRLGKKLSQAELADLSDVDVTMVNKIELGERRPSPELAQKLGLILGINWTKFYE